jgi:hypothetical protein
MNSNQCSYSLVNINMAINEIINVTDSALVHKRSSINSFHFKKINETLLKCIYKNNKPKIIGIDETFIPLSI